jgi:hypothetical protein
LLLSLQYLGPGSFHTLQVCVKLPVVESLSVNNDRGAGPLDSGTARDSVSEPACAQWLVPHKLGACKHALQGRQAGKGAPLDVPRTLVGGHVPSTFMYQEPRQPHVNPRFQPKRGGRCYSNISDSGDVVECRPRQQAWAQG